MSHKAEILAIGTEVLMGEVVNSDAAEVAGALSGLGIDVCWHSVVGDNPERLRQAIRIARGGGLASCLRGKTGARKGRSGYRGTTSEEPGAGTPADAMSRTVARVQDETIQNQP